MNNYFTGNNHSWYVYSTLFCALANSSEGTWSQKYHRPDDLCGGLAIFTHLKVTIGLAMQQHPSFQNESCLAPRDADYFRVENGQPQQWAEVLSRAHHGSLDCFGLHTRPPLSSHWLQLYIFNFYLKQDSQVFRHKA